MLVASILLVLTCYHVTDGNNLWPEQRAKRDIQSLLENYTFTIRDDYDDKNITAFLDFEMRYKAARNALRNNLKQSEWPQTDPLINEELDKLRKKNGTKRIIEPRPSDFVLEGRKTISMACFTPHMDYVARCQTAGCTEATAFARNVCSEFKTCMENKRTSYWICKPKICSAFKKMTKRHRCYNDLFKCD